MEEESGINHAAPESSLLLRARGTDRDVFENPREDQEWRFLTLHGGEGRRCRAAVCRNRKRGRRRRVGRCLKHWEIPWVVVPGVPSGSAEAPARYPEMEGAGRRLPQYRSVSKLWLLRC